MSEDYIHENSQELEKRLAHLRELVSSAQDEVRHARGLRLDLGGPIRAAQTEVERLSTQIAHLERLIERVRARYPYWERLGFEQAIDASGETWSWQTLSTVPAAGTIWGHDEVAVRVPVRVQQSYEKAAKERLFEAFEICSSFETSADGESVEGPIRHYLFGTIQSLPREHQGCETFLIAIWEETESG